MIYNPELFCPSVVSVVINPQYINNPPFDIPQQPDNSVLASINHNSSPLNSVRSVPQMVSSTSEIPIALEICKDEILRRGISVEGIFRRSGSTAMIEKLMNEFQTVNDPWAIDLSSVSIHSVAGLFKRYLQQLSEPVVPMSFQPELLNAYESTPNVYQKRDRLIGACQALPQKHCELLSLVLYTAHAISRHSDQNKMSAENLAIIFAPTCIRLDGLAHLLSDDSSAKSTHKGSTITISDNNKPSQVKTRLLRTVSLRFGAMPSSTSSLASLASREQGIGNFCRSVLSRPKHAMDEEKPRSTYSVLRYAPDKLMELNLIKENSRWNKLFEFMINHPPLPRYDGPHKPLSPILTTLPTTVPEILEASDRALPETGHYGSQRNNESGTRIMMEVIDETMAALSDETAEFFESILENHLDAKYRSSRASFADDDEDPGSSYGTTGCGWLEKEEEHIPQPLKRNSVVNQHHKTFTRDWIKSLSQNVDFSGPVKKRPLSLNFIPRTQSRISTFLR